VFKVARQWWCTPLIPALGRQRRVDLCEFETSLVYTASSRTGFKAIETPCLEKQNKKVVKSTAMWCLENNPTNLPVFLKSGL
ncbi:hypothetical protein, partial [Klebsiella pneumoniae]|uniref:hypothetical protein n=1 Tax=Klebsiella pneumoniae TaxID=573 RepID=UPI00272F4C65